MADNYFDPRRILAAGIRFNDEVEQGLNGTGIFPESGLALALNQLTMAMQQVEWQRKVAESAWETEVLDAFAEQVICTLAWRHLDIRPDVMEGFLRDAPKDSFSDLPFP